MKLFIHLGEIFFQRGKYAYAYPPNMSFLNEVFNTQNEQFFCSSQFSSSIAYDSTKASSSVPIDSFIRAPNYNSSNDFIKRYIFNYKFRSELWSYLNIVKGLDAEIVWLRLPNIMSLYILIALYNRKTKFALHMCADAKNAWRSPKYKGVRRLIAFVMSFLIHSVLLFYAKKKNVVTFTTGSKLEKQFKNANRVIQLVDVDIEPSDVQPRRAVPRIVGFLGRIAEDKGVFDLVAVCEELMAKRQCDLALKIAGTGPDVGRLQAKTEGSANVELLGYVKNSDTKQFFSEIDVLVVPSKNQYEGFPRVILEAWAHDVPVIISDVGGISAFAKNGVNSLIYKAGDRRKLLEALEQFLTQDTPILIDGETKAISSKKYWAEVARHELQKI